MNTNTDTLSQIRRATATAFAALLATGLPSARADEAPAAPAVAAPTKTETVVNLLENGSFESGLAGFYVNQPTRIRVDTTRAKDGLKSLRMTPAENPKEETYVYVGIPSFKPGQAYRVSFLTQADSPAKTDATARPLRIDARILTWSGKQALSFWSPARTPTKVADGPDLDEQMRWVLQSWTPTDAAEWTRFTLDIPPLPAKLLDRPVEGAGIHLRLVGDPARTVWFDSLSLTPIATTPGMLAATTPAPAAPANAPASAAAVPAADLRPAVAIVLPSPVQIFTAPEPVTFRVANPPAGATLTYTVRNERGTPIATATGPAAPADAEDAAFTYTPPGAGYFAIDLQLADADGKVLATDTTSFAIVPPLPDDYYSTPVPAFGVWGLDKDLLALGGAKWTRQIFWNQFEERGGERPADSPTAEQLAAKGPIKVIRQLNVLNAFKPLAPMPKEEWPATAAYLDRTIIRHKGLVDVWETQNELMVGENFSGTMADAFDLLRLGSEAVRRQDPETPVASICINPMVPHQYAQYLTYFRDFGAAALSNGVTVHPYTPMSQSPEASDLAGVLNRLGTDLAEIAGREVPLYITEIGYSTRPSGEVTELEQAAYMVRTLLVTAEVPSLKATVWHIGYFAAGKLNREGCFSLMRWTEGKPKEFRQPKPAYVAWATASRQLYDATYLQPLEFGVNTVGRLYTRPGGRSMLVAYSLNNEPETLRLHVRADAVTITDLCGASRRVLLTDGILALDLDGGPVYIEADSADAFDDSRAKFTFNASDLHPGEWGFGDAEFDGLKSLAAPRIVAETPAGWRSGVSMFRMKPAPAPPLFRIDMTPPADTAPGRYRIFLKIYDGPVLRHAWQREVKVVAPLVLHDVAPRLLPSSPDLPGGGPGFKAMLGTSERNSLAEWWTPDVSDIPISPFGLKHSKVDLPKATLRIVDERGVTLALRRVGEPGPLQVPLLGAKMGTANTLTAQFTLDNGYHWQQPLPDLVAFAIPAGPALPEAPEPRGVPRIDGDLGEWDDAVWYPLPAATNAPDPDAAATTVARGRLAFRWTPDALVVAVDLQDDTPALGKPDGSMFGADSIQLGVSVPTPNLLRAPNVGIMETDYAEIGLTATADGPASWVWASMNRTVMELHGPVPAIDAAVLHLPDGRQVYEAAIPWASLGVATPKAGMALRLSLTVNDRAAKHRYYVEWYQGIATGKDSRAYGLAILAPPAE